MLAAIERAREIRGRIWNPVNGHHSTELEIVTEPVLRRRRIEIATRSDVQRRERETRERAAAMVFDLLYHRAHQEHVERERGSRSVESILKAVCLYFGVTRIDVLSERRTADIVRPRHVAMYLAKTLTLRSLPEIGRRLGGRDHTTVLNGVRKIQGALDSGDPKVTAHVIDLRKLLGVGD